MDGHDGLWRCPGARVTLVDMSMIVTVLLVWSGVSLVLGLAWAGLAMGRTAEQVLIPGAPAAAGPDAGRSPSVPSPRAAPADVPEATSS